MFCSISSRCWMISMCKQAQEAAAEAEAQRVARFRNEGKAGVVEAELLQLLPQVLEIGGVDRIHAAEDHLLRLLITGQRLGGGI